MGQKLACLTMVLLMSVVCCKAQSSEDSVKMAVNRLFEGMIKSDPALLRAAFGDSAVLQTIVTSKEGRISVRNESIEDFAVAIGKLAKGSADERIEFGTIRIDGPLAIVWAPYRFYFNGKFTHCGVDSFQLVRINGEWKIEYLIDTRRKDCY